MVSLPQCDDLYSLGDVDDSRQSIFLGMARQLNLNTVSEGVETQLQMDYINLWGGTLGQGYLWSPAVPFGEFSRMVMKREEEANAAEPWRQAAS